MYLYSICFVMGAAMLLVSAEEEEIDATGCKHGSIRSPGYPGNYGNNIDLGWFLTTDPGRHIVLTFSAFDLEGDVPGCHNDYLKILEEQEQKKIACGDSTQVEYTSITQEVTIRFHSNGAIGRTGFEILWHPVCDECPLSGCDRTSPDPPCVSYHSCRWGYYLHDFSCPDGSTIQCQDDCYACADEAYTACSDHLGLDPDICVLERETPCGRTQGVGILIRLYKCHITAGVSYDVKCSAPCCCLGYPMGPDPAPEILCSSPIMRVYQNETDCPGFRSQF